MYRGFEARFLPNPVLQAKWGGTPAIPVGAQQFGMHPGEVFG